MNDDGALRDKVAVVTGAARGIGRAIAMRFAAEGARVAVTARTRRNGDGAYAGSVEQTVADITVLGGKAVSIVADLASPADRATLITEAQSALGGPVQILVNNAAATRNFELRFTGVTADEFHHQVDVNVWAGWELAQRALDGMKAAGAGWILNISSQGAAPKVGPPYRPIPMVGAQCLYGSTKAMLDRLTTGAAMELWPDGIAVNSLAPEAAVATENANSVAAVRADYSEPAECFAEAALALCSGDPTVLTGRVATSLSLLAELGRPVRALDGVEFVAGWQPADIAPERLVGGYLSAFAGTPQLMRAALYVGSEALAIADDVHIANPAPARCVTVSHCGICHSDYSMLISGYSRTPLIPGRRASGVVEAVGAGVTTVAVGDKVVLSPTVACGACRACMRGQPALCAGNKSVFASSFPGGVTGLSRGDAKVYRGMNVAGFAETALVAETAAIKVPDDTPLEIACVLGCAVQTGAGAALNTADIIPGDTVVVLGGGGIGLSVVQGCRIAGASQIVVSDPLPERRALAATLGATHTVDPTADDVVSAVRDLTAGDGADTAFEASGVGALQLTAIEATRAGGTTVLVGAPPGTHTLKIPTALMWGMAEKKLVGCFMGSSNARRDIPRFLRMWRAGQLDLESMITARRPLDEINAGLADMVAGIGVRTVIEL